MATNVTIYHNPHCSKSRDALVLLEHRGFTPKVVLYLVTPPSVKTLANLLQQLGFNDARQLIRNTEQLYKDLNLADTGISQHQLLKTMSENPILIERPIVIYRGKARIGRPTEQLNN